MPHSYLLTARGMLNFGQRNICTHLPYGVILLDYNPTCRFPIASCLLWMGNRKAFFQDFWKFNKVLHFPFWSTARVGDGLKWPKPGGTPPQDWRGGCSPEIWSLPMHTDFLPLKTHFCGFLRIQNRTEYLVRSIIGSEYLVISCKFLLTKCN